MALLTNSEQDKSAVEHHPLMMQPVATMLPELDEVFNQPWSGTFTHNSWTANWAPTEKWAYKTSLVQPGFFLYSHSGYSLEVERFLRFLGMAHVFIYRDLRDVVVSQAYHVTAEDDIRFQHPDKELFRSMDSIQDVIKACIVGEDIYAGVFERWELYAPWLDVDWVLKVRFDELLDDTLEVAARLLRYGLDRVSDIFGVHLYINDQVFDRIAATMVACGNLKEKSPTFRKGKAGGWKTHFTPEIVDLFKEADTNNWLRRLGYVEDNDWGV
jgi:hypothetical protein